MAAPDPVGYIFGGTSGVPTYEELKRRRAIAVALASRQKGFPKTLGEGMTYLGESIGDMLAERRLSALERQAGAAGAANLAALRGTSGYEPGTGVPPAAPPGAPARPAPAARPALPPEPVRPPPAPAPPRPQVSMVPVRPTPSDPYGATEGTGEGFEPGGILNPTPMTSELTPPPGMRGDLYPSEGTPSSSFIPSTAAAPPSTLPAPAAAPPVSAMDFASWPQGPIRRPTDTAVEPGVAIPPVAPPAAPATPRPPEAVSPAASLGPQSDLTGFIAKQEGFRPTAYSDYKQTSIGYGTRGTPGETITREEAQRRLESEVAKARGYVEAFAPEAPPGVKNALTSLTYNAGPGWQQAGLGRLIKEGRYDEARDRFTQYNKAGGSTLPGLVSRRNAEISQLWNVDGTAPTRDQPDAIAQEMRSLPQRGGEGATLASYAPSGVMSDAPVPGMGGAGAMRIRPQIPPLPGPPDRVEGRLPPASDEQVTPTAIEPMPATAQLQSGVLGQFGPPTGRFSEAPLPGVAAAPPSPPSQGPPIGSGAGFPAAAPPPTPQGPAPTTYVGSTPSREPIPPAQPQTMEPPGPPPVRNYPGGRPLSQRQQRAMQMMQDPRSDPASAGAAEQIFKIEEEYRKRAETQDESDYAAARTEHTRKTHEFEKFRREEADRELKQLETRTGLEKARADLEEKYYNQGLPRQQAADKARLEIIQKQQEIAVGKAPQHATMNEVPVQWDQATNTWREIDVKKLPVGEGPPTVKLTKEQSDELQHLTKVRIALDQYGRVRDADKILAEGLKDELAGRLPFFGNAALSEKYRVVRNAASNFLQGHLRSTSGAAIGAQEMATHYSSLVPLYGDDPVTIRNKQQQREGIAQGMYVGLGSARPLFDYTVTQRQKEDAAEQEKIRREMPTNPEVGKIYKNEKGRRRYWTGSRWEDD